MADTNGRISLDKFINSLLLKENKPLDHYMRYRQIVIEGIMHISIFHDSVERVVKLTPDSLSRINWPDDYIDYMALGIPVGGRLWTFTRDDRLVITTSDDGGGGEEYDTSIGEGFNVSNGQVIGYGAVGGKNPYYFKNDKDNRRFVLNGFTSDNGDVWLYYFSSGVSSDVETYIPSTHRFALEKWVRYQMAGYADDEANRDKRIPDYIIRRRKEEWEDAIGQLRNYDWTLDEVLDVLRSHYKQTPRR